MHLIELQQIRNFDRLSPIKELNCQWLVCWIKLSVASFLIKLPVARFLLAVHFSYTFYEFTATALPRAFILDNSFGYQNGCITKSSYRILTFWPVRLGFICCDSMRPYLRILWHQRCTQAKVEIISPNPVVF